MKLGFSKTSKITHQDSGFVVFFITILILTVMLGIVISISILIVAEYKISRDLVSSTQAYYTAEAGIEDMILRLKKTLQWSSPYNLNCGSGLATVTISDSLGGARTVISQGNVFNQIRKIQAVYNITADEINFYYGAQIGDGGMQMGNNSQILGNVFSNSSVIASAEKGYIDNSIIVAGNGNKIDGLIVGKDAMVHTCKNSSVGGDLTYVAGGSTNCTVTGTTKTQPNEILPEELPISQAQANEWKGEAAEGGILENNYILDGGTTNSLGPIQIGTVASPKNMVIDNNSHLIITGTIYVTGNITFQNNVIIELDPNSYGSTSGIIIANGNIIVQNNAILKGSGQAGSYVLIFSTNNSLDPVNPAILVKNNAEGAIFYTSSGIICLGNNIIAREIIGYKLNIANNSQIRYESGLASTFFSSGPGGSWQIVNWREVE